jgi:uncharacterized protein (DUF1800 family)
MTPEPTGESAAIALDDERTEGARRAADPAIRAAAAATATGALAACGPVSGPAPAPGPFPAPLTAPVPAPAPALPLLPPQTDAQAARFLLQAQFSASDAEIAAVRSQGYAAWLDAQFAVPSGELGWDWLVAHGYATIDHNTFYDGIIGFDFMIWHQIVKSDDAVRKRVALAMSEFFVVGLLSITMPWGQFGVAYFWDQLVLNAFGNFRDLLEDVTLNPAMGGFLNTQGNEKENPATGRVPDENYAREVMQLFSIGLLLLDIDGTEKRDGNGRAIESYTQDDVTNLARVFTGYDWDLDGAVFLTPFPPVGQERPFPPYTRRPMKLDPAKHSLLAATFLGTTIPANTSGPASLKIALDAIFNHPNVGPFFGKQMIQRLVTSNPSPAYVARVATKFNNNGLGVRGDLKAVWTAILLDPEARDSIGLTSLTFGKVREPMLRVAQWARTFGVESASGSWKFGFMFVNPTADFGQYPLHASSVFNFFRPGYVPPSTALAATGSPAPEFQIVNESTVAQYINWLEQSLFFGMSVVGPDVPGAVSTPNDGYDLKPTYANELELVTDPAALVRRLNLVLCAGQLSEATQTLIVGAISANPVTQSSDDNAKRGRVVQAVFLVMACAEYLVQK